MKNTTKKKPPRKILGRYPGRTMNRIGSAIAGAWIGLNLIQLVWPEPDLIGNGYLQKQELRKIPLPSNKVAILAIITKEGKYKNSVLDKVILVLFSKDEIINISTIQNNLLYELISSKKNNNDIEINLERSYKEIFEMIGINNKTAKRYMMLNKESLNRFRNKVKSNFSISAKSSDMEMNRYISESINAYLKGIKKISKLKENYNSFRQEVATNINEDEFLSLTASIIRNKHKQIKIKSFVFNDKGT